MTEALLTGPDPFAEDVLVETLQRLLPLRFAPPAEIEIRNP